ncbi:MAG: SRPBCC family protein, partial [Candidatus Binatia bacterium]
MIAAPQASVWAYLTEPTNVLEFMENIVRWDVAGDRRTGLGARYEIRMKVGNAFVGGLVEIVEWDEGRELAWTSLTG